MYVCVYSFMNEQCVIFICNKKGANLTDLASRNEKELLPRVGRRALHTSAVGVKHLY